MDIMEEGKTFPNDIIETAALGRPFSLGMLYDCRKDFLIPGITLWDHDQLQVNTSERKQPTSAFTVTTSDSAEDKAESMNVSGSLQLSVAAGTVNVAGSGKYLEDTKTSRKQERLALHYYTTTKFKALTMSHLGRGNVSHPKVFEDGTATHVVTAILYGASAHFVFDKDSSSSSEDHKRDLEGGVSIATNMMKNLTVEGAGSYKMNKKEKSMMEKFTCTFHGDFLLSSNPTLFSEAVKIYRQLPSMLGEDGEHTVPVKVWLYPLVNLDSKAATLQREISNNRIALSSGILEHLRNAEMRCNDLLKDTPATTFSAMEEKLKAFRHNCRQYKMEFVQKLGSLLPSIRGGGQDESALADILQAHMKSSFDSKYLDLWLTQKEKESHTMRSFLKQLKTLGANMAEDLDELLSDLSVKNIVSFSFTSVDKPDPFLAKLSNVLATSSVDPDDFLIKQSTEWLSTGTRQAMRRQLQIFEQLTKQTNADDAEFKQSKKQTKGDQLLGKTKFIVSSAHNEDIPGACIFIYEDGCDHPEPFIPPNKPAAPTTSASDASCDELTVGVSNPGPATVEYRVEFRLKRETEWTSHLVQLDQESVALSGLKPDSEYEIRATAVGKLGYTVSSDAVTVGSFMTPPTNVEVTKAKPGSIILTWRNPPGQQWQSLRVEYKITGQDTEWTSHPVQTKQQTATLSGLQPDTGYTIKITAVGKRGHTVSSVAVNAKTKGNPPDSDQIP